MALLGLGGAQTAYAQAVASSGDAAGGIVLGVGMILAGLGILAGAIGTLFWQLLKAKDALIADLSRRVEKLEDLQGGALRANTEALTRLADGELSRHAVLLERLSMLDEHVARVPWDEQTERRRS